MRCDLRGRLALAVMNGRLMLMADMGPGNRRRERKHDQDDRRSQNSHHLLLWHDGSIVAQVSLDIAGEPEIQGPPESPTHAIAHTRRAPEMTAKLARAAMTRTYALSAS